MNSWLKSVSLFALLGSLFFFSSACASVAYPRIAAPPSSPEAKETIVLVHGLGRSRLSMGVLSHRLKKHGYEVVSFRYSPAFDSVDELSVELKEFIQTEVETSEYHLVAHSLGNVIIRNGFAEPNTKPYPEGLGRIVMLAPPNHPAKLAQKVKRLWPYRWITGDSGQKLADPDFYAALPIPDVEFGIIAGSRGVPFLASPNDGVVALGSTLLAGMTDWVSVSHTHNLVLSAKDTVGLAVYFLEQGRFGVRDPSLGLVSLAMRMSVSSGL